MQSQGQFITLRDHSGAKAVIAPDLGAWVLRYSRHLPDLGYVEGLHYSQEVVDRYPNQMYAGNPLLFPQVSFSHLPGKEHHYEWQGRVYALPQHGFARRSKWRVVGVTETRLTMELSDSPATREAYPFSFRSTVTYELVEGRLHFRQTVENQSSGSMPFSTGIHPYLPVPVTPKGQRANCRVELPAGKRVIPGPNWESWTTVPLPAHALSVQEDVSGTMFLSDLDQNEIALVDSDSRVRITLNFADSPRHQYVALWSKSTTDPFYCIEPWTALPNSLTRKESDLLHLPPGEKFEAAMWLDITRDPPSA